MKIVEEFVERVVNVDGTQQITKEEFNAIIAELQ